MTYDRSRLSQPCSSPGRAGRRTKRSGESNVAAEANCERAVLTRGLPSLCLQLATTDQQMNSLPSLFHSGETTGKTPSPVHLFPGPISPVQLDAAPQGNGALNRSLVSGYAFRHTAKPTLRTALRRWQSRSSSSDAEQPHRFPNQIDRTRHDNDSLWRRPLASPLQSLANFRNELNLSSHAACSLLNFLR